MRPQSQAIVVCHATAVAGRGLPCDRSRKPGEGGTVHMLSTTVGDSVRSYQTALQHALNRVSADIMSQIALEMLAAYDRDGRTFVFGNGGSAATASHMACDLSKNTVTDGIPHLRCFSLTDNTPL